MIIDAHLHCSGAERADDVLRSLDEARRRRRRPARAVPERGLLARRRRVAAARQRASGGAGARPRRPAGRLRGRRSARRRGAAAPAPRHRDARPARAQRWCRPAGTRTTPTSSRCSPKRGALGIPLLFHSGIFIDGRSGRFCRPTFFEALRDHPGLKVVPGASRLALGRRGDRGRPDRPHPRRPRGPRRCSASTSRSARRRPIGARRSAARSRSSGPSCCSSAATASCRAAAPTSPSAWAGSTDAARRARGRCRRAPTHLGRHRRRLARARLVGRVPAPRSAAGDARVRLRTTSPKRGGRPAAPARRLLLKPRDGREPRHPSATTSVRTHVLQIVGNAIVGGMENYVARLVERLPRERYGVSVLAPFESPFTDRLRDARRRRRRHPDHRRAVVAVDPARQRADPVARRRRHPIAPAERPRPRRPRRPADRPAGARRRSTAGR